MRHLPLILVVLHLFCLNAAARQSKVDSLEKILSNHPQPDTVRFNAMVNLAYELPDTESERALALIDSAISMGKNISLPFDWALAYRNRAIINYYQGRTEPALKAIDEAIVQARKCENAPQLANCLWIKGVLLDVDSKSREAIKYHQEAAAIYEKLKHPDQVAQCYNSISACYSNLSEYKISLEYLQKALKYYEILKDSLQMGVVLGNISLINKRLENYDRALEVQKKAYDILKGRGDMFSESDCLMKIGNIYDSKEQPEEAFKYYRMSYAINKEHGLVRNQALLTGNMGIAYTSMKEYDSAFIYLREAVKLIGDIGERKNLGVIYLSLSTCLLEAEDATLQRNGFIAAKKFNDAEKYLTAALALFRETEMPGLESSALGALASLYGKTGRYKEAYEHNARFITLKDSLLNDEKKDEIRRLEIQYEFEKNEALLKAEHDAQLKQEKTKRYAIIGGIILAVIAALLMLRSYRRRMVAQSLQKQAELQAQMTETEMKVLRLQMNPHFIFNSLNSISDYVRKNKTEEADLFLGKFAKVMRMSLENSEQKEITLAEDLKGLEIYLQLEARRLNNKFDFEILIDGGIDPEDILVPPMLLQPFVENSIWHGIAPKDGKGNIRIRVSRKGEMLSCVVTDDGVGRQEKGNSSLPGKTSMGVKISQARIDILNKVKKSNASLEVSDTGQGVRVELLLPVMMAD